jgi:hypothetical protein
MATFYPRTSSRRGHGLGIPWCGGGYIHDVEEDANIILFMCASS